MEKIKAVMRLVAIGWLLGTSSCRQEELNREGDYFFLRNKGADMPVWVVGNKASGTFVIFLHGGPGNGGITQAITVADRALQQKYAFVYWDQRGSGTSEGNADPATFTTGQFVEDLGQLVDLVIAQYHPAKLILLGHSWGGALGTAYLIEGRNKDRIRGWIEVDGGHDWKRANALGKAFVIDYANQQIQAGQQADFWRKAIRWYAENELTERTLPVHVLLEQKAHGYVYDEATDTGADLPWTDLIFYSPLSLAGYFNFVQVENHMAFIHTDYTPRLGQINTPTLVLWGRHDGLFPYPIAEETLANLGTDPARKRLVSFEKSAHSPAGEEPLKYVAAVEAFIDSLP